MFIREGVCFRYAVLALHVLCSSPTFAGENVLPVVTVLAPHFGSAETVEMMGGAESKALPASIAVIDAAKIQDRPADRVEDLAQQHAGLLPAVANAGLSSALNARGFDISGRLNYNGHPDIQRMFVRDLATVERIEVWKGHLSLLYGQGAPGATVSYFGKQAHGSGKLQASASFGSYGQTRIEADLDGFNQSGEGLFYRLVLAGQAGDTFIDNVKNDRQSAFATFAWRYGAGNALRLELEEQQNQRPFSFGTVYTNGSFQYDRSYVGPQARSERTYDRGGIYWDHALSDAWSIHGLYSQAYVSRDETLVGFWTIVNPTTLSSYYRTLNDKVRQQNSRLELRGDIQLGQWRHQPSLGVQRDTQYIDFSGPQNIGGFTINIENPTFDVDLSRLRMSRRITREQQTENAVYLFDRLSIAKNWHVLAGMRQTWMRVDTDNGTVAKTATDVDTLTKTWGIVHTPNAAWSIYFSRAESFEPNRGQDRFGGYIPPRQGRQYEAGFNVRGEDARNRLHAALFEITQSNLTTTDPLDRTALIAVGTVRSQGLELEGGLAVTKNLALKAQFAMQDVRNMQKATAGLGDQLPGVPRNFGALTVEQALSSRYPMRLWSSLVFTGQRPGDTANTFTAPGYARFDMGGSLRLDQKTSFQLNVFNLLDKRYVEAITAADNVFQGERRRIMVTLRHNFN